MLPPAAVRVPPDVLEGREVQPAGRAEDRRQRAVHHLGGPLPHQSSLKWSSFTCIPLVTTGVGEINSSREIYPLENWLSQHHIRGWRAISAAGLQGKGSRTRSVILQTTVSLSLLMFSQASDYVCPIALPSPSNVYTYRLRYFLTACRKEIVLFVSYCLTLGSQNSVSPCRLPDLPI